MREQTYTPDEIAKLFKISKHTVYELIKRGELKAFKVGNQMRIDKSEVERFKNQGAPSKNKSLGNELSLHIAGSHDFLIEQLIKYVSKEADFLTLRPSFIGSLEGLLMLYRGNCDIAAMHLLDPSSGEYNLPFIKLFFVLEPITVIRLASREQGFIVAKGNPKEISSVRDLTRKEIVFVNRQNGSGTRILLDSILKQEDIDPSSINGYENEEWNHLSAASYIASGNADAALGIRTAAEQLNLDFIPIAQEQFDLVLRWNEKNSAALQHLLDIIQLTSFKETIHKLKGYGTEQFGKIIYEYK